MPFSPVTEADLAVDQAAMPTGGGFTPITDADLAPEVGSLEALGRGAAQGVSLGFSDEITGALESLLGDKTYAQARDESRQANAAASDQHPYLYGGAELAAGLVTPIPGLGAAKAGAGIAAHAANAAIAGGVAGLGSSNADLTKGDFHGALTDTIQSALVGGALGAVGGKISQKLGGAGAKAEDQAIRALAGAESKNSGAAWQKTRRMVNNPETRAILHEPVELVDDAGNAVTTSLERAAGKEPAAIQDIVEAQTSKINGEIRPIYAKADAINGGVPLNAYIKHLDDTIAKTASLPPAEAKVFRNAYSEMKENALEQWGKMTTVPSEAVRAEATALQNIGFRTIDPLNPGLQTQVKREVGNTVRDFVNGHVMQTLGPESHSALTSLNKRMNAWLGVGTVAAARAEKLAAGNISGRGLVSELAGRGSVVASTLGAVATGNPAVLLAPLGAKALEHAPAAIRTATRTAAKVDARLKAVADAAAAGNPFAQKLLASIRQTPGGIARLSALQHQGGGAPPGIAPTEAPPDAAAQPIASQ